MSNKNNIVELTDEQIKETAGGNRIRVDDRIKELLREFSALTKELNETIDESRRDEINKRIAAIKDELFNLQLKLLDDANACIEL